MSTRFPCYLAPLRKEWDLSQEELAALLPRGSRNRVSDVESGKAAPNAEEILAYRLIFGAAPHRIFPKYAEEIEDLVMRNAHALYERLKDDPSQEALSKRKLLENLPKNAASTGHSDLPV
jgi:transcriptional regulator with XRE-family HTH domain